MKQLFFFAFAFMAMFSNLQAQGGPKIVAQGFTKGLIGLDLDAQGNLYITEHGTGNDDGQITIVDPSGNKTLFMTGLPSTYIQAAGEVTGSFRTYHMPNNRLMIVVGEGTNAWSESLLIVNKADFTPGKPLTLANVEKGIKFGTYAHAQGFVQSDPFHATWDPFGNIYLADAGANSIFKWDKTTGAISTVKTMDRTPNPLGFGPPMIDPVPTKVLLKPDSSFYVCQLTGFPFIPGSAKVYNLKANGQMSEYASGFTCLTDMNFDPKDKNLCVLQFGVFGMVDTTFNFKLGTAAVIKLLPNGKRDTIARGIGGLAPSFIFDGKGSMYVSDLVFGQVLKYDLTTSTQESILASSAVKVYPNPFSEQTTIEYTLKQAANVQVDIFDLNGRLVANFREGNKGEGTYNIQWNGTDGGKMASPGTYVYRIIAGDELATGVLQLIK
jgi:hypothetical protein